LDWSSPFAACLQAHSNERASKLAAGAMLHGSQPR